MRYFLPSLQGSSRPECPDFVQLFQVIHGSVTPQNLRSHMLPTSVHQDWRRRSNGELLNGRRTALVADWPSVVQPQVKCVMRMAESETIIYHIPIPSSMRVPHFYGHTFRFRSSIPCVASPCALPCPLQGSPTRGCGTGLPICFTGQACTDGCGMPN